jgi:hypothetical protein
VLQASGEAARWTRTLLAAHSFWPCRHSNVVSMIVRSGGFEESPGDHFEGHFEGQNAASERQSELATASVS